MWKCTILPQHHLWKKPFFSLLNGLGTLIGISRQQRSLLDSQYHPVTVYVCICASTKPRCFHICSFIVSFEIRKWGSSNFVLLFQDCFGYSEPLAIPCECENWLLHFCKKFKNAVEVWIGIALNLLKDLSEIFCSLNLNLLYIKFTLGILLFYFIGIL